MTGVGGAVNQRVYVSLNRGWMTISYNPEHWRYVW